MTIETMRKKLLFRAMHRGTRELDLIIGGFAQKHLAKFTEQQLTDFEWILDLPETDLGSWLTEQQEVPTALRSPMMDDLKSFRPTLHGSAL
jgi:antitoxin CptB